MTRDINRPGSAPGAPQKGPLALAICGSPRHTGNTATILRTILDELAGQGWRTQTVYLAECQIGPCTGCDSCRTGQCPQEDDMAAILGAMREADLVVIGSPVYWGNVTGQLKVFIDRSLPACDTRTGGPLFSGHRGVSVVVRAGTRPGESLATIAAIEHYFGHLGIAPAGSLHAEQLDAPGDIASRPEVLAAARALARDIAMSAPLPDRGDDETGLAGVGQ